MYCVCSESTPRITAPALEGNEEADRAEQEKEDVGWSCLDHPNESWHKQQNIFRIVAD